MTGEDHSRTDHSGTDPSRTDHARSERRRRPRAQVHIEAELRAPGTPPPRWRLAVRTIDLSGHGAFVRTARPLPVGSAVQVVLRRGAQRNPLVLAAEVVRVGTTHEGRVPGLALRFTGVTPVDEASLQALIAPPGPPSTARDYML